MGYYPHRDKVCASNTHLTSETKRRTKTSLYPLFILLLYKQSIRHTVTQDQAQTNPQTHLPHRTTAPKGRGGGSASSRSRSRPDPDPRNDWRGGTQSERHIQTWSLDRRGCGCCGCVRWEGNTDAASRLKEKRSLLAVVIQMRLIP